MRIMPTKNEFYQVRGLILALRTACWAKEENVEKDHVSIRRRISLSTAVLYPLSQGGISILYRLQVGSF